MRKLSPRQGTVTPRRTNAVRSERGNSRRSLAQGDQGAESQTIRRRRQRRTQDIRIEQRRWDSGKALGAICAARTIAQIMLRTGVVVRIVFEHRGGIVLWCPMARMHTSGIRRRCSRHRQRLHHRRTGKRQCQNKRKREAWQGHAGNSNIANRARQIVRGTRIF